MWQSWELTIWSIREKTNSIKKKLKVLNCFNGEWIKMNKRNIDIVNNNKFKIEELKSKFHSKNEETIT